MYSVNRCRYHLSLGCRIILCFFVVGDRGTSQGVDAQTELPGKSDASAGAVPASTAELPDESHLPGDAIKSPKIGTLPDESILPDGMGPGITGAGTDITGDSPTNNADSSAAGQVQREPLPSEAELPIASGETGDVAGQTETTDPQTDPIPKEGPEAGDADPLGLEQSLDNRPWLRLVSTQPVNLVRALTFTPDGSRLTVAGDDKSLLVYAFSELGDKPTWQYERTIRWQVQRGPLGIIYAMDAAGESLAMAGYSAMGSLGDLLLVDPATGRVRDNLMDPEKGNRQRITAIAFAPGTSGTRLAAMDMDGRLVGWSRDANSGQWTARTLADDTQHRDELRNFRRFHPIVMLNESRVVAPHYVDSDANGPRWQLKFIDWNDPAKTEIVQIPNEYHHELVTAMAATQDGTLLATADARGHLYLWETSPKIVRIKLNALRQGDIIVSMSFSPDGKRLLLGTFAGVGKPGEVKWLDIADRRKPQTLKTFPLADMCSAVAVSPAGRTLAFASGSDISIRSDIAPYDELKALKSEMRVPTRVAFPSEGASYQIGIATSDSTTGDEITELFDTQTLQLQRDAQSAAGAWHRAKGVEQGWQIKREVNQAVESYWLMEGEQKRARVPLNLERHGAPSSVCWIPDAAGKIEYFAIGVAGQSNIYLFRIARDGECPRVREFRGHSSKVVSLSYSADMKYLASASLDGTINVWRLDAGAHRLQQTPTIDRWGAGFVIENGVLYVRQVREDGPLFFRGVRNDDQIESLRVVDADDPAKPTRTIVEPQAMLKLLLEGDRDVMIGLDYRRGMTPQRSFWSYPAWHPLATLLLSRSGEWAYWTPQGYYDASFEGHKLFGWQVNRGPATSPDFYLAAQLRKTLERPDIMSKLLVAGSLDEAFRQAEHAPPANVSLVLRDQTRLAPEITIVQPAPGETWTATRPVIQATIRVPAGEKLARPKAYTNGVVASGGRQQGATRSVTIPAGAFDEYTYLWEANVPDDPRVAVQVFAATESEIADMESVTVTRPLAARPRRRKVYIAAAAVDQYRDAQVPQLSASVKNTQSILETFKTLGNSLYDSHALFLQNDHVTVSSWQIATDAYASELVDEVTPDDLLVIYLAGHGVRDEATDTYYYLGADARFADVMSQQYEACLSFDQFRVFADLPCRKLVVLDTCHSGAVQPLEQRNLKVALRALHDDMVLTLTASEGGQQAVESRFARRVLEGLRGAADEQTGDRDQVVTLDELAHFVRDSVAADAEKDGVRQRPMAGPSDLFPLVNIPLTRSSRK